MRYWLVLLVLSLVARSVQAQQEYYNWYFGSQAGLAFTGGARALTDSRLPAAIYGDIACLSDGTGRYQFTTNGYKVWDRNGQVMAGGDSIGRNVYNRNGTQVLGVPQPGQPTRYYVFNSKNAVGRMFKPAFNYAVVDMSQRSGLGAVVADSAIELPFNPRSNSEFLLSNFVAVRHANGRDLWIVMQNVCRQYVSFLLTPAGLQRQPIISPVVRPAVVSESTTLSLLKASPDGKTLALSSHAYLSSYGTSYATSVFYHEVAAFSPQSGRVSDSYVIPDTYRRGHMKVVNNQFTWYPGVGGLEFSPDGSRLYVDTLYSREVWQYDLLAGAPAAVAASRAVVARLQTPASEQMGSNLQLGPDGRIYVADNRTALGRFELPNAQGLASDYRDSAVPLGRPSGGVLPHATNDLNLVPVVITDAGTVGNTTGCAGGRLQFASSLSPFVTATAYHWDFGDPTSGPANTAAGQAPAHLFAQPGRYTVALVVMAASGQTFSATQAVTIQPVPTVSFSLSDSTFCYGAGKWLNPGPQPAGTSFRWSDGSTQPELLAMSPGAYQVDVTNAQGCSARARVTLKVVDCPVAMPNIITPNGDDQNETLVLPGQDPTHWSMQIFSRWGQLVYQRAPYDNSWNAAGQPAGVYYYLLTNPSTGQRYKGWVEVVR